MAERKAAKDQRRTSASATAEAFSHKAIIWWLPILYCLISSLFYLRTYDSAQVKITVMQMGGAALLAMWAARLLEAGWGVFNKDDLVCLSPFLAYLAVGILSFAHAPYHMASVDFFLRHFFFMTAALIVIYEFDARAMERLTDILVLTAWIAVGYGFLQWVDITWFPKGAGNGIDPFIWRGAFGDRIFSTYGNPNFFADFLVIVFPILLTQYLKTRRFSLIPLMAMLVVDLLMTGTKGAWLGFALVIFLFGVVAFIYFPAVVAPIRKAVLSCVVVGILVLFGYVARDLRARVVSVNFRLFTWESTWEMIMTHPWIGTGVGSFPPIYPAFRRPAIFHIEGKHNTETDHSEDEYLEELFDNGILGFGIFIWLILSTLVVGFRSLGQLSTFFSTKDGRAPPRAYDLVGYMIAFMGMLGHNCFDVSLRFVSSGVYLGLLSGTIVNLARGKALYEFHDLRGAAAPAAAAQGSDPPAPASTWKLLCEFLIWPARLAAWGGLLYAAFLLLSEFSSLQGSLGRLPMGGELMQWWLAWGVFAGCVLSLIGLFLYLTYLSQNPVVPLVIAGMLYPLYQFWGYFKADVNHNIAIYFSKDRHWDEALAHYLKVRTLNPNFVMSMYFMGNVYNDRFNMNKVYNPGWGDAGNAPRDDYERALDSYEYVRQFAPNYVQMHHQVGNLHMRRAEWAMSQGRVEESDRYLRKALTRFYMYQAIDPVFEPNYFRIGQIYMIWAQRAQQQGRKDEARANFEKAVETYEMLIDAPKCAVDRSLLDKAYLRNSILSYQPYVQIDDAPLAHKHESAEAYTNLANAYFMLERWKDAEKAYRRALVINPGFAQASTNLAVLGQKMRVEGRLKAVTPPLPGYQPENAPPRFEIVPSKR
ncbi:MAG: tetratricopeptide repeat protein [Elusimicrobia bacterium]|nr:tetratricopeptide repeat protein [Elusimicrobiota bacterium]